MRRKSSFIVLLAFVLVSISAGQTSTPGEQIAADTKQPDTKFSDHRDLPPEVDVQSDGTSIVISNTADVPVSVLDIGLLWFDRNESWSHTPEPETIGIGGSVRIPYHKFIANYDEKRDAGIPSSVVVVLGDPKTHFKTLTFNRGEEGQLTYSWEMGRWSSPSMNAPSEPSTGD
jgi:hypothetical protein